jgi:hypothetical protein
MSFAQGSAAALSLLSEAAETQPLLCLIDDAQWLDRPSAKAFAFAVRRLLAESVAMVFSVSFPPTATSSLAGATASRPPPRPSTPTTMCLNIEVPPHLPFTYRVTGQPYAASSLAISLPSLIAPRQWMRGLAALAAICAALMPSLVGGAA